MKRMTKLLSLVLAALMLVGMLPLGVWAAGETHTVRFNLNYNGAPKLSDQKVADGEYATQPEGVIREGWHFAYWYVKLGDNKVETFDLAATPITKDVTLYARWTEDTLSRAEKMAQGLELAKRMEEKEPEEPEKPDEDGNYTVSFMPNGSNVENMPAEQKVKKGETAVFPSIPTRNNYLFIGWFLTSNARDWNTVYTFNDPVVSNLTLYAKWVDSSADTDNDGLPDEIEEQFGLDPTSNDTDGDGLPDNVERFILGCDPTKYDTDGNGISDGQEDADNDRLTNAEELALGTDPMLYDTDGDGLSDKDELDLYKTDPTKYDTDGDGFSDGWEIEHGTDPLVPNDKVQVRDELPLGECSAEIEIELSGEQNESFILEPALERPFQRAIPGQIGMAISLSLDGAFPESGAHLSFHVNTEFPQNPTIDFIPTIYYYNPELQLLEEIPTAYVNGVAKATLSHFSTYILLNKVEFDKVWEEEIKAPIIGEDGASQNIDVVFAIDVSGSMSGSRLSTAKTALHTFLNALAENDRAALVKFSSYASVLCELTKDKETVVDSISGLSAYGKTSMYSGLESAISLLTKKEETYGYKMVILLSDGKDEPSTTYESYYANLVATAKENKIIIYTVGAGSSDTSLLTRIANETGGAYYSATVTSGITDAFTEIQGDTIDLTTDSNNDKIPDYFTRLLCEGKLVNGAGQSYFADALTKEIINEYPDIKDINELIYLSVQKNADFDNDGLLNGEELVVSVYGNKVYVKMISDPTKKDSDADTFTDSVETMLDGNPLEPDIYTSDLTWLTENDFYVSALSAEKYIEHWWYRVQLGLGNYVYGGEYNWQYAAQKQLLDIITEYAQMRSDTYAALYQKSFAMEYAYNFLDGLKDFISYITTVDDTTAPFKLIEYYSELAEANQALTQLSVFTDLPAVQKKIEEICSLQANIEKYGKGLNSDSFLEHMKPFQKIRLKVPSWLQKSIDVTGKIGKGLTYITATYESIDSIGKTLNGFAAISAADLAYNIEYDAMKKIARFSQIGFVRSAANLLAISIESQYAKFAIEVSTIIMDVGFSVDEIAIDFVLGKMGPIGWAIAIGRGLGNMISGVGDTCKEHIYMIAAGETARMVSVLLDNTVSTKGYYFTGINEDTLDYYLLCGLSRISGENKVIDASDAQTSLFQWLNHADEVKKICKTNIDRIKGLFVKYKLSN